MKISVVIPTFKRPLMLQAALKSVEAQSRPDLIHEVVVSENSDDNASREICKRFPRLPIRHIVQSPPLYTPHHFYKVVEEASSPWVAMLGDDDMWSRYHLEEASRLLSIHTDCTAYFGQSVIVRNESRQTATGFTPLLHAVQESTSNQFSDCWIWNPEDMFRESLLKTPLNMWSMVSPRAELLGAMRFMLDGPSGLDSDRVMIWNLGKSSRTVVGHEIGTYYRKHDLNEFDRLQREDPVFHDRMAGEYTLQMIDEFEKLGGDPKQVWKSSWTALSPQLQRREWQSALKGAREALSLKWPELGYSEKRTTKSQCIKLAEQLMPPFATSMIRSLLGKNPARN